MKLPWSKKPAIRFDPSDPTIITNILQRMGVLTPEQVAKAVNIRTTGLIGQVLVAMQFCTQAQVDAALWQQKLARRQLKGRALVVGTLDRVTKLQEQTAQDFRDLAELASQHATKAR